MFKRQADPALDMDAPVGKDDSLINFQFFASNIEEPNKQGKIDIMIKDTNLYLLPNEAFIEIEGEIVLKTDTDAVPAPYPNTTQVGLVNNGIMALFDSASYLIDGKEIETIQRHVDIATTVIGLARYSDDYTRSNGPSMMFAKDNKDSAGGIQYIRRRPNNRAVPPVAFTTNPAAPADANTIEDMIIGTHPDYNLGAATRMGMLEGPRRKFSCAIQLSHIFGFCRNVRKVIYGVQHTVSLTRRENDDNAIWRIPANPDPAHVNDDAGKIKLTKLKLWMPSVTPSILAEQRLISFMASGGKSLLSWLSVSTDFTQSTVNGDLSWNLAARKGTEAPRHVFIVLQDITRADNQLRSNMIFDKIGVTEVSLEINGKQEPTDKIKLNFDQNHVARAYHKLLSFMGRDQNVDTGLQISQHDFRTLYPIYYFSLEHLDLMKQSVVGIYFQATIQRPAHINNYRVIAIILSDKSILLEGVGGQMKFLETPIQNL